MVATDTSERGLERLICTALAGHPCEPPAAGAVAEPPAGYGGAGWSGGSYLDYDREWCVDLVQLAAFLRDTQPEAAEALALAPGEDGPTRRKFLARLQGEIAKRGTVEVLRHGIRHGAHDLDLFYGTPSPGNEQARDRFERNRFTVTRQLRYSRDETQRALDIALFINGLPVVTFELKNNLTKQTVDDAVQQYRKDRNPREKLFELGRCVAHFAVDEAEVRFCTHLRGKASWFLPFNRGWNDGAGNPPNPSGIKTDYLWREVLTRERLTHILENYAQVVESRDERTGRKTRSQIWPRYHQLDVVRRLLADAAAHGAGRRYLVQHSAGSGKSNSIAWLAHQLIGLRLGLAKARARNREGTREGRRPGLRFRHRGHRPAPPRPADPRHDQAVRPGRRDRGARGAFRRPSPLHRDRQEDHRLDGAEVPLHPRRDRQRATRAALRHHHRRGPLQPGRAHQRGDGPGALRGRRRGGGGGGEGGGGGGERERARRGREGKGKEKGEGQAEEKGKEEDETFEDRINRLMESRRLLPNASYFAFTATPKNKTLEIFGEPDAQPQPDGAVRHRAFHGYAMKQAIQEGFILDVLAHYTPVASYYKLAKTVEDDPEFDVDKARKKLRRFVEGHDHAIRLKAEIMVDHFLAQVLAQNKIGGEARAMVVTNGIERAIQYFHAIRDYLAERKSRHRAIVAFSGEHEFGGAGAKVSEASLNGFPSGRIAEKIREEPYRFLVCADKFQTGYDEPLLHTMYVDKTLSGIQAVQTLSRLNRAHPKKHDVFVLDFLNDAETIRDAFADFYRATILADETDPDKLHDLQADLDGAQVYSAEQVEEFVRRYLGGAERDRLDPILDACVAVYLSDLDEDGQVDFKGKAKGFVRTYAFLSCVLPYTNAEWEKRSIFLNFLVPKLPAPREEDLSKGILDAIDMDSYRVEKRAMRRILLPDEDAEIDPVPAGAGGHRPEPELDRLSNIIRAFNDLFGDIQWEDADRVRQLITETIPARVAEDTAFRNAHRNSDRENARIEHDRALLRVMTSMMKDDNQLFKQFMDNDGFKRWMTDTVFELTAEHADAA